ncbi:MAG: lysophospholipid acyltransferase family protein [Chloroflexota bacterium]
MRRFVRWLIIAILNTIGNIRVIDVDNVPASGGFVIATNHIGIIDIAMFHYQFDRYDMFIPVAEKWEKQGWIRFLGKELNFLFVDRYNQDVRAMKKMINLMKEGNSLVIAPEGTRSRTGALIEGKPGVAYLAARSGFPVIPVAITGTEDSVIHDNIKHFKKSRIELTVGRPFYLPPIPKEEREAALTQYTDEIMCQIAAILPERYRGVYAEHPRLKELI